MLELYTKFYSEWCTESDRNGLIVQCMPSARLCLSRSDGKDSHVRLRTSSQTIGEDGLKPNPNPNPNSNTKPHPKKRN